LNKINRVHGFYSKEFMLFKQPVVTGEKIIAAGRFTGRNMQSINRAQVIFR